MVDSALADLSEPKAKLLSGKKEIQDRLSAGLAREEQRKCCVGLKVCVCVGGLYFQGDQLNLIFGCWLFSRVPKFSDQRMESSERASKVCVGK